MKKFFLVLVAVAFISPSFAEEKAKDHAGSDKKVESTENKTTGRSEKEATGKGDIAKKLDACLKARPDTEAKK